MCFNPRSYLFQESQDLCSTKWVCQRYRSRQLRIFFFFFRKGGETQSWPDRRSPDSYANDLTPPLCSLAIVSLAGYFGTHSKWSPQTLKHFANGFFQCFPLKLYPHLVDYFNCLLGWPAWPNYHSVGVGVFHWINCFYRFYWLDQSSRLK